MEIRILRRTQNCKAGGDVVGSEDESDNIDTKEKDVEKRGI